MNERKRNVVMCEIFVSLHILYKMLIVFDGNESKKYKMWGVDDIIMKRDIKI